MSDKTHFGYKTVDADQKEDLVAGVFDSVARKYDLMNDVMSLGIHRIWKKIAMMHTGLKKGRRALDVAGGTGDLTIEMSKQVGADGEVVISDINPAMLEQGRRRLIDKGIAGNVSFVEANAEDLPFDENSFDCVTIAFGLRNVTHQDKALESMYRVLKPGGRLLVLEFSKPVLPGLDKAYDFYSFNIIPLMGRLIAKDENSYRYLAESIRMHPDQATLKQMMQDAGFERCTYHNMSGGIVALHKGFKL
ncbi:MAG: bifunctional demethylmenaquinone methyltransferase/2-methoxy-6-polyprenyl-1,4-benzoquinol methylase UbiE [Gammaproteobacteria bacterium]|nr:bifunctional demethylmenaquinone methyltransferase/2-methoxy-6-polyprenyl-1,4-benzoquinol methylase UbiE [Gammaproteobacteria bacterium]NNJ97046.1 bifunctional demethylmenaquinone methyltransferase/2-methoxy-6-polyprenyl-1,4-benzoquinol methylase UbiE [Gammaproteobacteria bacterium]